LFILHRGHGEKYVEGLFLIPLTKIPIIIIYLFNTPKQQRAKPKNTYNTMLKLLQIATNNIQ